MAADDSISPGPLSLQAAVALQLAAAQAGDASQQIANLPRNQPDEFPAKITAYDSTTGACSWTEQTWSATGGRTDHWNGRTGAPTTAPAFPVGNGVMPPPAFPVEVWLRRRTIIATGTAAAAVAYEFDWVCACSTPGSSGTGSFGGISAGGCIGVPLTLTATGSGGISTWNGASITISFIGGDNWYGTAVVSGHTLQAAITFLGGAWTIGISDDAASESRTATGTCDPFAFSALFVTNFPGLTITVTE